MSDKLKIGIILESNTIPRWKYNIVDEVQRSGFACVSLILKVSSVESDRLTPGLFICRLHQKIDSLIFIRKGAFIKNKDISELIMNIPVIRLNSAGSHAGKQINGQVYPEELRDAGLDVIINLGSSRPPVEILKTAKYGVWSFTICDGNRSSVPSGYYEVVEKNPVTETALVILKENPDEDLVISHIYESTCTYSVCLNRERIVSRAIHCIEVVLNGLYKSGDDYLLAVISRFKNDNRSGLFVSCTNNGFSGSLSNLWTGFVIFTRQILKKLVYSDPFTWVLMYKKETDKDPYKNSYATFDRLESPADRFWADPYPVRADGKTFVFVEEFLYKKNKAHISVLELDEAGKFQRSVRIIEKPYHMSYPFIFTFHGKFYMIPETSGNRTIDLYQCESFPFGWQYKKNLMNNIDAVDTTIFNYNGKWWLFTSVDKTKGISGYDTELFLFFSDDFLTDTWQNHPCNPIVTDVRVARPAGAIFSYEGNLYRPSQDCAGRYGKAFNFNKIIKLTETEYQEEQVIKVDPAWDKSLRGTHTYNTDTDFKIIDTYLFRKRMSGKFHNNADK